jgi:hypothetical protein
MTRRFPGLPAGREVDGGAGKFRHLEAIPADATTWHVNATRAGALAATLVREKDRALLFRDLATLRTDVPVFTNVDELLWKGPTPTFATLGQQFDAAARRAAGT